MRTADYKRAAAELRATRIAMRTHSYYVMLRVSNVQPSEAGFVMNMSDEQMRQWAFASTLADFAFNNV